MAIDDDSERKKREKRERERERRAGVSIRGARTAWGLECEHVMLLFLLLSRSSSSEHSEVILVVSLFLFFFALRMQFFVIVVRENPTPLRGPASIWKVARSALFPIVIGFFFDFSCHIRWHGSNVRSGPSMQAPRYPIPRRPEEMGR